MNTAFLVAAILSLIVWTIHTFLGGAKIAKPLLRSKLQPVPKYTNDFTWHMVTILLFAMAAGYAYAAFNPDGYDVAILLTALSVCFMLLNLGLLVYTRLKPYQLPQWFLFLVVNVAAIIGLLR